MCQLDHNGLRTERRLLGLMLRAGTRCPPHDIARLRVVGSHGGSNSKRDVFLHHGRAAGGRQLTIART